MRRVYLVSSVMVTAAVIPVAALAAVHGLGTSPSGSSSLGLAAGGAAGLPSKQQQTSVLDAALTYMRTNYTSLDKSYGGTDVTDIFDYGVDSLWQHGTDGAGTTIALVTAWDDPQITSDADAFAKGLHLPDPQIQTIYPAGPLPSKCPAQMTADHDDCSGWATEEAIDVDAIHLIAPYAKILVAVTPADTQETDDAAGNSAPPEFMKALETISSRHLADVISISGGNGESTYSSDTEIRAQDAGELAAAAKGIPVLVATGDSGVVQQLAAPGPGDGSGTTTTPDVPTWSDSPWVTAVGGSVPNMSTQTPTKLGPDPLWSQEGGGYSSVYSRPSYQDGVSGAPMRSLPDITMDAQIGTSEAAPLLAGVLALATQVNQGDLGPINPALYGVLGPAGSRDGIADVVKGDNSATIIPPGGSSTITIPGYAAGPGFDTASGWGTLYAPKFVPALVAATASSNAESAARAQAQSQLSDLQHAIQLTHTTSGNVSLRATGLLPGHPATLAIDNKPIATLTINPLGDVTYMISPTQLKLSSDRHTVTLTTMLLTETATFTAP